MRTILFSTAALAAACPSLAQAAPPTPVGELVVTATRLPSSIDLVTGARIIDRAEIEARQSVFVTDLLATVPGVGVSRNGGFGGVAAIRIRGAAPDKTLVLIDGVPVGDPADPNGSFDAGALELGDVERIEVLSGPQSSLWGSEAIGGVVSLTSREIDGWRLTAEGGSFGSLRGFAGAGLRADDYALSATLHGDRTDGISKADKRFGATEKDGYKSLTGNVSGRLRVNPSVELTGRVRYTRSTIEVDGYAPPAFLLGDTLDHAKSRSWLGVAGARIEGPWGVRHSLSVSAYDLDRRSISSFPSHYTADRQVYRWTAEKGGAEDRAAVVAGLERTRSGADLDGRASVNLSANSAFVVARVRPAERLTLTGSLRYDDPDRFKGRTTGRLSAAVGLGGGFTVTAAAGQGFKTPTVSQVACDFCFPAGPSLGLKPERADGEDLRLGWTAPGGTVTAAVTGYRLRVRDQISYVGRYVNIARTRSNGLEAEAQARLSDQLTLKLAYAWVDAIDVSTSKSLLRVPDHSGAVSLFWNDGAWSGAFTARGESSQSDTARNGFSPARRPAFVTADLAGAYALNDQVSFTARIENLADARYEETFGYGEAGRAVYVGVRLRN